MYCASESSNEPLSDFKRSFKETALLTIKFLVFFLRLPVNNQAAKRAPDATPNPIAIFLVELMLQITD